MWQTVFRSFQQSSQSVSPPEHATKKHTRARLCLLVQSPDELAAVIAVAGRVQRHRRHLFVRNAAGGHGLAGSVVRADI